jgi:hypothetical protein
MPAQTTGRVRAGNRYSNRPTFQKSDLKIVFIKREEGWGIPLTIVPDKILFDSA